MILDEFKRCGYIFQCPDPWDIGPEPLYGVILVPPKNAATIEIIKTYAIIDLLSFSWKWNSQPPRLVESQAKGGIHHERAQAA
jgi:hypothetical protein